MKSPVLFLIFNRPDTTKQVFEEIRKAQPPRLYIAADGPRSTKPGEKELCERSRAIATAVDWSCEVKTLFRNENLGCGIAVCQAITWFFNNECEGIILEDDILPHPDFFTFCDELLEKYRDNRQVGAISGHNLLYGGLQRNESYGFMAIGHIWGWASWRRSWNDFEYTPSKTYSFNQFSEALNKAFPNKHQRQYWENIYKIVADGVDHIWDYQWTISLIYKHKLSVVPYVNLTKNIGFRDDSTHTSSATIEELTLETQPILPITHPKSVIQDLEAEELERINSKMYINNSCLRKIKQLVKSIFLHKK